MGGALEWMSGVSPRLGTVVCFSLSCCKHELGTRHALGRHAAEPQPAGSHARPHAAPRQWPGPGAAASQRSGLTNTGSTSSLFLKNDHLRLQAADVQRRHARARPALDNRLVCKEQHGGHTWALSHGVPSTAAYSFLNPLMSSGEPTNGNSLQSRRRFNNKVRGSPLTTRERSGYGRPANQAISCSLGSNAQRSPLSTRERRGSGKPPTGVPR